MYKNSLMKTAFLFMSLLISSYCYSQDWEYLLENEDGTYYFKLRNSNSIWLKTVSEKTVYFNEQGVKRIIDGQTITLFRVDCDELRLGLLSVTVYNKMGQTMQSETIKEFMIDWEYALPDSIGELIVNKACEE